MVIAAAGAAASEQLVVGGTDGNGLVSGGRWASRHSCSDVTVAGVSPGSPGTNALTVGSSSAWAALRASSATASAVRAPANGVPFDARLLAEGRADSSGPSQSSSPARDQSPGYHANPLGLIDSRPSHPAHRLGVQSPDSRGNHLFNLSAPCRICQSQDHLPLAYANA